MPIILKGKVLKTEELVKETQVAKTSIVTDLNTKYHEMNDEEKIINELITEIQEDFK